MRIIFMIWFIAEISDERRLASPKSRYYFKPGGTTPRPRVLHGWSDAKNEYSYVVSLLYTKTNETKARGCTGSLITEKWIVTAAHCIMPPLRYVQCGDMRIPWDESECKSKILEKFRHPSYIVSGSKEFTDIGLLRIEEIPLRLGKKLGRLHAADGKTFLGRTVRFAGFGMTYYSYDFGPKPHDDLVDEDEKRALQVGDGMIFTARQLLGIAPKCSNIRHGPYFGDSGGPLIVSGKIVGVLSLGSHDHRDSKTLTNRKHPEHNFYTPISPYLDWIRHTININNLQ